MEENPSKNFSPDRFDSSTIPEMPSLSVQTRHFSFQACNIDSRILSIGDTSMRTRSLFSLQHFLPMVCLGIVGLSSLFHHLPAAEVTCTVRRPIHPLLIRKDFNPVLRLAITVPENETLNLQSIKFSLTAKQPPDAAIDSIIESLQLFTTGKSVQFSAESPICSSVSPTSTILVTTPLSLKPGLHHLWLATRIKSSASLNQKLTATCVEILTKTGPLLLQEEPSAPSQRIGVALRQHNEAGVHTYRIPALATSKAGNLLCVYDMRRNEGRDLQEDIDIGLARSTNGGQTWTDTQVIMDMGEYGGLPQSQNGCSDPGIIVDRETGEIFCFAVWMNGKPGKHQWNADGSEAGYEIGKSAQILMVKSSDEGLTWTKPENLTRQLKQESWWLIAPAPQQGINLPDGTLVMPMQGRDETGETFATIMSSRDHGRTWKLANPACSQANECQAAELGDGSIMLNIRNDKVGYRAVMITKDLGQTWTEHATHARTLIEPTCNASLYRVDFRAEGNPLHALLFANPHTRKGRTHHTIQVSFDDGLTWPESHHLLLDEGRGAGYPSLTRVDDAHVGIVYEGSQSHLVFERISLDELKITDP